MSDLSDRIYNASPVALQNLAVTLYGLHLRRLRYGGRHAEFRREIDASARLPAAKLRKLQSQSLRALVGAAKRHVAHYSGSADYARVREQDLTVDSLPDLLPVLPKQVVRNNATAFHSNAYPQESLVTIHTSGTSGTPLDIRVTRDAVRKNYAFFARMLGWYGVAPLRDRSVSMLGRLIVPQSQNGPPYWRHNRFMNNLLMSSYRISDETISAYLQELGRFQPRFIDSYPSAIYSVASHALRRGLSSAARPRVVVTSSETVLPRQREAVEQAFGCPLRDHYGCAEMAALISQCEHGRYHVNPEYAIVEVLRPDGTACAPGEAGELCCTGLINDAMPLIRYQPGDSAVLGSGRCECGRDFPIIEALVGRTDDVLKTPDGREIGRLDPVFKGLSGIVEAQIVQSSLTEVEVLVVPAGAFEASAQETLRTALLKRLSPEMSVSVRVVASIPRGPGGKFRSVVSKVQRARL